MSSTPKNVDILTTLENDPHVTFFSWEMDVHDVAASMAKSIHPHGLLSEVLTDAQWAAYPGNSTIDQAGNILIADRYQLPADVDIHGGMNNIDLYVAKASNDRLQLWIDSREVLKRAILKSLGRVVRQVIKESKVRFQLMTVLEIMTKVRQRYGKMEKDTRANLRERMHTLLPTADDLDTHISNLQEMFDVSETAGFPLDSYRQVETFRDTVCAHPTIVKVLEKFDFDYPDAKTVTFAQITGYLILHLPNVKHAQMAATRATANLAASTAYSTLEVESQRLRAAIDKLKRKRNGGKQDNNKNKQKKQNGKQNGEKRDDKKRSADEPTKNLKYCYGHGFQHSHISSDCKMLAADTRKYTAAMRRATAPDQPPGGSTKVNGQVPSKQTKTVNANVAMTYDLDGDTSSNCDENPDLDETAAFLASVMNEDYRQDNEEVLETNDPTISVTAMMMEDHTLLFDETTRMPPRASIIQTDEVPRSALDVNQGDPKHVGTVIAGASALPDVSPNIESSPATIILSPALSTKETNHLPFNKESSPATTILSPAFPTEETNLSPNETNLSPKVTLITDGSQFRLTFWIKELESLQNNLRRHFAGRPMTDIPSRRTPYADELQIQFVTWLSGQSSLPLLVSPTSSGFYSSVWGLPEPVSSTNTHTVLRSTTTTPHDSAEAMEGSKETPL